MLLAPWFFTVCLPSSFYLTGDNSWWRLDEFASLDRIQDDRGVSSCICTWPYLSWNANSGSAFRDAVMCQVGACEGCICIPSRVFSKF